MMRNALILSFAFSLLAACGKAGPLERTPAMGPQPVPYGAQGPTASNDLIRPSTQAIPGRSRVLIDVSESRSTDPFDLPPGGIKTTFPGDSAKADTGGDTSANADERGGIDTATPADSEF